MVTPASKLKMYTAAAADKGTILIHKLPSGTEFGIDYNTWYIGPKFCGLNAIPSGFHFVFTSSVDKQQQHSPRNGQFLVFLEGGEGDAFYQSYWDERNEELVIFEESQEALSGVMSL